MRLEGSVWWCGLGKLLSFLEVELRANGTFIKTITTKKKKSKNRKRGQHLYHQLTCMVPEQLGRDRASSNLTVQILKAGVPGIFFCNPVVLKGLQPGRRQLGLRLL